MRVALINPNTTLETTRLMVAIAAAHCPWPVEGLTAPWGETLITTPRALDRAAQAVQSMLPQLEGFDAVVVAAFGDPGQAALADALSVPVVGIAEAAMAEAHALVPRFGVVTTTPDLVGRIARRAADLGHGAGYAGCWITPGDPVALTADPDRLVVALLHAARAALADDSRIEALVIGGGPLAEAARAMAGDLPVPVIQPIPAALRLVQVRLSSGDTTP